MCVFFSCALFLQISRTLAELHWARRRRHHDHAASCLSAHQESSACSDTVAACTRFASVDLLAPSLPGSEPGARVRTCLSQLSTFVVAGCGCQNARRPTWLILPCGLHTRSCALRFEEKPARTMLFCVFPESMGRTPEGGVQKLKMPCLLCFGSP